MRLTPLYARRLAAALGAGLLAAVMAPGATLAPLAPGNAVAQSWSGTQSEDDIRYRLGVIDAEVQSLKAALGDTRTRSGDAGAALGGDTLARLQRLEGEITRLTGQIEDLRFRVDQISADATRRFGDIEFRLTELEGGDISALGPTPPVGGTGAGAGGGSILPDAGGGTAVASTGGGAEVSISERSDLDRAIRDVQQGRFDQAEDRLSRFLTDYPGSPLEGEALFWRGESQFVRGAFQEAARSYLGGYQSNRQGSTAAQNLLKLGVTLGRLGQTREACLTLLEVPVQFPGDDRAGAEAASEADRLRCG